MCSLIVHPSTAGERAREGWKEGEELRSADEYRSWVIDGRCWGEPLGRAERQDVVFLPEC